MSATADNVITMYRPPWSVLGIPLLDPFEAVHLFDDGVESKLRLLERGGVKVDNFVRAVYWRHDRDVRGWVRRLLDLMDAFDAAHPDWAQRVLDVVYGDLPEGW